MSDPVQLVKYSDLLEQVVKKIPAWKRDRDFFSVRDYLRFAVLSGMSPQAVEPMFVEWVQDLASREPKPYKHNLLPRETTKTSLINSLCTFLLAYPDKQIWGPRVRLAVSAEVRELSERNSGKILQALESNQLILREVGSQKPDKDFLKENGLSRTAAPWSIRQFKTLHCLKQELKDGNRHEEPSCTTISSQKATTGRHYDILATDDPVTGRTARSDAFKEKARNTHMEMQSQISAGNSLQIILGTRHADDDLHYTVQQDFSANFTFQCRTVWDGGPELYKDDFEKDANGMWVPKLPLEEIRLLWNGYGQLGEDAPRGGFPADENERKRKALHFLRTRMDDYDALTWTRNMLNRSMPDTERIFKPKMFREYNHADFRPQDCLHYVLTDAASGRDFRSSYRVVAVVAFDSNEIAYVRHVEYGHWTPSDFSKRILDAYRRYTTRGVVLEQMAWMEVVKSNIELQAQVLGITVPRIMVACGINESSKRIRVESLEPRFTNEKIYFSPELKASRGDNGKVKWDEIVSQFMKVQDIDSQPNIKIDIADTLSLIDGLDKNGSRICRGPKTTRTSRSEAERAAGMPKPGQVMREMAEKARARAISTNRSGDGSRRSIFGGGPAKRGFGR